MGFTLRFLKFKIFILFLLSLLSTVVNLFLLPFIIISVPMLFINIILWMGVYNLIIMYNVRNLTIYEPFLMVGLERKPLKDYYLLEYKNKKGVNYILKLKCDLDKNQYKILSMQKLSHRIPAYNISKQDYTTLLRNRVRSERNKLENAV